MNRLSITVPIGFDETIASFVSRLAAANGVAAPQQFAQHMGMSYSDLVRGDGATVGRLMELAGQRQDALHNRSHAPLGVLLYEINGELLDTNTFNPSGVRYCPKCIERDMANGAGPKHARAYGRLAWCVGFIVACPKHRILLRQAAVGLSISPADLTKVFAVDLAGNEPATDDETAPHSSFEAYVDTRLWGKVHTSRWIDTLPLYMAGRMCERVGFAVMSGGDPGRHLLHAFSRDAADIGYQLLGAGDEGLERFLRVLHHDFWRSGANPGKRGYYLRFCKDKGLEPDSPHQQTIYAVAMQETPLAAGDDFS